MLLNLNQSPNVTENFPNLIFFNLGIFFFAEIANIVTEYSHLLLFFSLWRNFSPQKKKTLQQCTQTLTIGSLVVLWSIHAH